MKLTQVHVREFVVRLEFGTFCTGDITCLVGKNEAGKTAVLSRGTTSTSRTSSSVFATSCAFATASSGPTGVCSPSDADDGGGPARVPRDHGVADGDRVRLLDDAACSAGRTGCAGGHRHDVDGRDGHDCHDDRSDSHHTRPGGQITP